MTVRHGRFNDEEMDRIMRLLDLNNSPQFARRLRSSDSDTSFDTVIDDERVLAPRFIHSSYENSISGVESTTAVSPDELVIRQRGRKKFPTNVSWSPIKQASSMKTPTKKVHHLSLLLSPSPAKRNLNKTSPMVLRSSPRKRAAFDSPGTSSTPFSTPTKRLKFEEKSINAGNPKLNLSTLLKGLSQDQLINIIVDMTRSEPELEDHLRETLPLPDLRPLENQLNVLKKNIIRSLPRSRILSKTDSTAFSRAAIHLSTFKRAIFDQCKTLHDSQHFDALLDYTKIGWSYTKMLPKWDNDAHNASQRDSYKILAHYAKLALKLGGFGLGADRIKSFQAQLESMLLDVKMDDLLKCQDLLDTLLKILQSASD